jgi:hypothetical protein
VKYGEPDKTSYDIPGSRITQGFEAQGRGNLTINVRSGQNTIRQSLAEDAEDIAAFDERVKEPLVSYDEMVTR